MLAPSTSRSRQRSARASPLRIPAYASTRQATASGQPRSSAHRRNVKSCGAVLLAGSVVDETTQGVTLSNGAVIQSVPSSMAQIRGWSIDLLILDEAGFYFVGDLAECGACDCCPSWFEGFGVLEPVGFGRSLVPHAVASWYGPAGCDV
jgi:hypothetical protein